MNNKPEAAATMFLEGYNCAQSVLACCGQEYGLPREVAVKVAQAFGGGMGRTGGVCGAATGALMVIGLKCSARDGKDTAAKEEAHRLAREFLARFKALNGSMTCRDLLGCDLSTEKGFREAHDTGRTKAICPKLIKHAVGIIEDLLNSKE